jgi:iron-chelate-transporting ATPase
VATPEDGNIFDLREIGYAVNGRSLVGPISLELDPGRVYGLIGHNGSGKSTLVKLLARQLRPSVGTLSFRGRPVDDWRMREFARAVAYLPQTPPTAADLTVRDVVSFGRYPWHGPLGRFTLEDRRHVEEALTLTDMQTMANRSMDELSGGERQRAWLAMLLAQDAGVMLLDEPTSALDIAHQIEVLGLVRELSRRRDLCVVVVLHDPNLTARYCDEMIALRSGSLFTRGVPQDIMTPGILSGIFGIEMATLTNPRSGLPIGFVQ